VKDRILQTLKGLREYALRTGYEVVLSYHEERSYLMRFANSAISLNASERLIRLNITAHSGKKRASYSLITDLDRTDEMRQGIDTVAEMVEHSQPLTYQPTVPVYGETFVDESGYDEALAQMGSEEKLQFFNQAAKGLETEDLKLSGIFSCGSNTVAMTNTKSDHALYFRTSDAQVTAVLAHEAFKWEVIAEQSAQKKSELDPTKLQQVLAFLIEHHQGATTQQLPLGTYDVVFGPAAIAEMASFMNWIGYDGGLMKRDFSFLTEDNVGQKIFSDKFTLVDNPERLETFPFKMDFTGTPRKPYPIIQNGVFQGFVWAQDDADEFGAEPTGHTVTHKSLVVDGGDKAINSLVELVDMPRERDILYIPFLHYMNIVNPSKGMITASSRFGALLLRADGSVVVPYNVRLTQSLLDIFGDKVNWLSQKTIPYNTSHSYGARNPTAVIVPRFMKVNDLEISHSNPSY
jgi:predicted Zn-dependent protease